MTKDPFERYNANPEYFLKGESEPESLKRIESRIDSYGRGNPKMPLLRWLAVGAAAIFIAFLVNDVFFEPSLQQMAVEAFDPYPNYVTSVKRSAAGATDDLYRLYDNGHYIEFVTSFANGQASAVDSFYIAQGYLALSEWQRSLKILNDIGAHLPGEYRYAYKWYHALALIGDGQKDAASAELNELRQSDSSLSSDAEVLYNQIR